jgi:hypothetical protein
MVVMTVFFFIAMLLLLHIRETSAGSMP